MSYCPHCGFSGTEDEVDDHRASGVHNDEPQAGSNRRTRPAWAGWRCPDCSRTTVAVYHEDDEECPEQQS